MTSSTPFILTAYKCRWKICIYVPTTWIYIPTWLCGGSFIKKKEKKHPPRGQKIPTSQFSDLTCQSFRGSWCLKDDRPFRPPAAPQRNTLPPVTAHPFLPYFTPHPSWARQTKIKSEWSESGPGSHFADQSVDTWLSLTGRPFNPIVSPTGLLSVVPLSLWLRAGERPD